MIKGNNYQIDNAPLKETPLLQTNNEALFIDLVDKILALKKNGGNT